jgi:hypothetical protein
LVEGNGSIEEVLAKKLAANDLQARLETAIVWFGTSLMYNSSYLARGEESFKPLTKSDIFPLVLLLLLLAMVQLLVLLLVLLLQLVLL